MLEKVETVPSPGGEKLIFQNDDPGAEMEEKDEILFCAQTPISTHFPRFDTKKFLKQKMENQVEPTICMERMQMISYSVSQLEHSFDVMM